MYRRQSDRICGKGLYSLAVYPEKSKRHSEHAGHIPIIYTRPVCREKESEASDDEADKTHHSRIRKLKAAFRSRIDKIKKYAQSLVDSFFNRLADEISRRISESVKQIIEDSLEHDPSSQYKYYRTYINE